MAFSNRRSMWRPTTGQYRLRRSLSTKNSVEKLYIERKPCGQLTKRISCSCGTEAEPFTAFVDALIRAHGFVHGIGDAQILTSLRTSIADGGVDTEVRLSMPGDPTGYLERPTCWQYKARRYADISDRDLLSELDKPYARTLIKKGYGYRLAVCDDMPPKKQTEWRDLLSAQIRIMNPDAPGAEVATASQLASWANCYPALLPAHFGFDAGPVLYFDAWSRSTTKITPTFVPVDSWGATVSLIESHIDLTRPAKRPTVPLQGMAGVGKTRLVHEAIVRRTGMQHLVLYTCDGEDAEKVARILANDRKTRCILVADECSIVSRVNIGNILRGDTDRVRVVCIDNSGERPIGGEEELCLRQLAANDVEKVLERNFPRVSIDRRRAYSDLSGGYIRFAADLCEHDAEMVMKGHLGPGLKTVQEYYLARLPGDRERRAVEAIALLQKVGFAEGVAGELEALCELTRQSPEEIREAAAALKDAPGFVVRTTRYLYITPEIIARIAFENAWRRWIEGDPDGFLRRVPPLLLESFRSRVGRCASVEVRARMGQFFWGSVAGLRPADLANENTVEHLATLVDTDPDKYFPKMAALVAEATLDDLRESKGGLGHRGSRRKLVWAAERLAGFPKFFTQSEAMLRRLALAETEERVGNNATGVWKELFRIQLSGSATPFSERMNLLDGLLLSEDAEERRLASGALEETLDFTGTRLVGPAVVAGQLVPPDWRPRNINEFAACLEVIIGLFDHVFEKGEDDVQERAWVTVTRHVRPLLAYRMLPALRKLLDKHAVPDRHLPAVLESIEDFLQYECGGTAEKAAEEQGCSETVAWLDVLTPKDFARRLKAIVGKDPWHHSLREENSDIPSALIPLAEELFGSEEKFETVLPYLNSTEAASGALVGDALARLDTGGLKMDGVLTTAARASSNAFARGYIGRLLLVSPELAPRVNEWIDRLEKESPVLAFFVALAAYEHSHPLARTLRMIRSGAIPVQSLQHFIVGVLLDRMTSEELSTVLDALGGAGDTESLHIAIDFVGHCVQKQRPFDATEREAMWRALEFSAPAEDRADYWWTRALQTFSTDSPERACDVAILGLTGKDYEKARHAWSTLALLARSHPEIVMDKIGPVMLDRAHRWRFGMKVPGGLFHSMPVEIVGRWLEKAGIDGARVIAGHLPSPSLDAEGRPLIHSLTEFVLTTWGDDEEVFGRFAASTHHLQLYTGDMALAHRREAERARPMLTHPIRAIRRWAENEVVIGETQARQWDLRNEEQDIR